MLQTRFLVAEKLYPVDGIVIEYLLSVSREWKRIGLQQEYETCLQCPEDYEEEMWFGIARSGNLELLKAVIPLQRFPSYHATCGRGGHRDLFEDISKNVLPNNCVEEAARGGHIDFVSHLLNIVPNLHFTVLQEVDIKTLSIWHCKKELKTTAVHWMLPHVVDIWI